MFFPEFMKQQIIEDFAWLVHLDQIPERNSREVRLERRRMEGAVWLKLCIYKGLTKDKSS